MTYEDTELRDMLLFLCVVVFPLTSAIQKTRNSMFGHSLLASPYDETGVGELWECYKLCYDDKENCASINYDMKKRRCKRMKFSHINLPRKLVKMDNSVYADIRDGCANKPHPLGMEDGSIPDSSITASSTWHCGENNIPLRGLRDSDPTNAALAGNFQALLEFQVDSGDQILEQHLENAPRNATYISKTIQNQMISTVGAHILNNLSQEMRDSKYFSVMADEAADIANKENISVVIRFLDSTKNFREEFIGMYICKEGTTGEPIKDLITAAVVDLGLMMEDCRGQCYDGAGNMAGQLNGASSLIRAEHEKAIFVHCMNHQLNLCIANTCQIPNVRNMMDVVRKLF
ncbi:52 kDa repressor of the inhibitor of the protein kinase-like [Nematostella vectensis]|uniref:52 kDa repressor of the inhibitor of the protein kinase-like n=1 Tax=Nematostella vectensis TaxID=45351 RepID=UPI002076E1A2|nr:52 kDa repressor of the inhibitor of the protein kinase-like [Nematostella vectensis]